MVGHDMKWRWQAKEERKKKKKEKEVANLSLHCECVRLSLPQMDPLEKEKCVECLHFSFSGDVTVTKTLKLTSKS
jgi:hypothetical protein